MPSTYWIQLCIELPGTCSHTDGLNRGTNPSRGARQRSLETAHYLRREFKASSVYLCVRPYSPRLLINLPCVQVAHHISHPAENGDMVPSDDATATRTFGLDARHHRTAPTSAVAAEQKTCNKEGQDRLWMKAVRSIASLQPPSLGASKGACLARRYRGPLSGVPPPADARLGVGRCTGGTVRQSLASVLGHVTKSSCGPCRWPPREMGSVCLPVSGPD